MNRINKQQGPIGIFDSGVGGLSVFSEVKRQFPNEDLIYIADQAHVPYGIRSKGEVLDFSEGIVRFLITKRVKLIIIACNTASAVALAELRRTYPSLPFVGMEPAVKPAAEETSTGVVGVLATPATFQGDLYAITVEKFAKGVKILQDTCPGLVNQIEKGDLTSPNTREILETALGPMLKAGVDEIVMGCTHYPFVIPLIKEIVGDQVEVIDPAPAIARQAGRLLEEYDLFNNGSKGKLSFYTSGSVDTLQRLLMELLDLNYPVSQIKWSGGSLKEV